MKVTEMQGIAQETFADFIRVMPDVPFGTDDIIIEFVPKSKLVERFKALCGICCPRRILNESQEAELAAGVRGNAIIGEEKSAVIIRVDYKLPEQALRIVMFHEFMHIYCAKTEVDGEHFIDIYGNGLTIDDDDYVDAGYHLWSEFIAQYYALLHTGTKSHSFDMAQGLIFDYISKVVSGNLSAKDCLAQTYAYLITCSDFEEVQNELVSNPDFFFIDSVPYGADARRLFLQILSCLREQLCADKPCKINSDFMVELGEPYTTFLGFNTLFLMNDKIPNL
jgi:hypothetical protein